MAALQRHIFFLCILLVAGCLCGRAQQRDLSFVNYTTADGLADHAVLTMMQDSRGFMWLGTREGLSRFDGTRFRNFFNNQTDPHSLPGNYVSAIFERDAHTLLLLCDGKITLLDTRTFRFSRPALFFSRDIASVQSGDGRYFFAGRDTCFVTDPHLNLLETLVPPVSRPGEFMAGAPLDTGRWLLHSSRERWIYHRAARRYQRLQPALSLPEHQQIMRFLHFDPRTGWLFFSNYWSGLYALDTTGRVVRNWNAADASSGMMANDISFFLPAREGGYWAGSIYGGLSYLKDFSSPFRAYLPDDHNPLSLPSRQVFNACYDRFGNLWLATNAGLSRQGKNAGAVSFFSDRITGAPSGSVMVKLVKGSDGRIYSGVYSSRIAFSLDAEGGDMQRLPADDLMPLWDISRSGQDVIFSGAGHRVALYDTRRRQLRYSGVLHSLFPSSDLVVLSYLDRQGDQWYSGNNGGGLVRIPANGGSPQLYTKNGPAGKFSHGYYSVCAEDHAGNLWFGVNKSDKLLKWIRSENRFTETSLDTLPGIGRLKTSVINDLEFDGHHTLWIATDGTGIVAYNLDAHKARMYTMDNGLLSNYISSLVFDDRGRLWAGTLKGLNGLMPGQQQFAGFTKRNGLPADYFSEPCMLFDSSTRRLWLGSNNSLLSVFPDSLVNATVTEMPVFVDDWLVNDQLRIPVAGLTLRPQDNRLIFRYVAVDINGGTDVEYAYRLEGFNRDWVYAGSSREAGFMDLPPGTYHFRVKARHAGTSVWNEMQPAIHFTIDAPWYRKTGFILLLLMMAVAGLVLLIRAYLSRRLRAQKLLLEKELAVEQERIRMARELHDGLGSMLSGIKHSLSAIGNEATLTPEQHVKFDYTVGKLDDSIKDLRAVSHGMFSAELLEQGLEAALSNYCAATSATSGLPVTLECIGLQQEVIPGETAFHLFRMVQELLQNVVRHASATSAIVQVSCHEGMIALTVEDNGRGFDMAQLRSFRGIGLKNVESRVKSMKGRLDIRSQPGKGTSVLVEVPLH